VSRRFAGQARVVLAAVLLSLATLAAEARADSPRTPGQFLGVAENGLAATQRAFWNQQYHWYDWRLTTADPPKPLASLWAVFPLFELVDAVAIASPSAAHKAAVEAIGRGAEAYLDPDKRWNGGSFPTRLLQPDAATLSLFAWLAAFTHR
jgi:hypothetical protein